MDPMVQDAVDYVYKPVPPSYESLSKSTTTVDIGRLQSELRALHNRLSLLEQASLEAITRDEQGPVGDPPESLERESVSVTKAEPSTTLVKDETILDTRSKGETTEAESAGTVEDEITGSEPPSKRSKRAAATNTEIKLEILGLTERVEALSERVESLTAAGRRREKAFAAREKTAAVTRMMEANRMQLAIASRVTSDELQQAVGVYADRISAVQSSMDTALNDRFRRVQDMVHKQMASLTDMLRAISQQQSQGRKASHILRASFAPSMRAQNFAPPVIEEDSEEDSDDSEVERARFVTAVTEIVQGLTGDSGASGRSEIAAGTIHGLQEDYEILKEQLEDKSERQDALATALEDAQGRLEDTETGLAALKAEVEKLRKVQEASEAAKAWQSQMEEAVRAASALAGEANGECAATRVLVDDCRREVLAEARRDAEALAMSAEGRAKAEVHKARGDTRTDCDRLSEALRRLDRRIMSEFEMQKTEITQLKDLSQKATESARAAATQAAESHSSIGQAEERIRRRLDESIQSQASSSDEVLVRLAEDEAEVSRLRDELQGLILKNRAAVEASKEEYSRLRDSAMRATEELRGDIQAALSTMVTDIMDIESGCAAGTEGRGGSRSGGPSGSSKKRASMGKSLLRAGDKSLASLASTLRKQTDGTVHQLMTMQRSAAGVVTLVRKLEAGMQALSTKELFWQAVDSKLTAHQRSVGDTCLSVEEATIQSRSRMTLPKEAQACLAGDMQRVAKLLATKADYEVIREIAKLDNPEQATEDWDRRLEQLRQRFMQAFIGQCRGALDKRAPELRNNFKGEEIRGKFMAKLKDALRVALSKFSPTTPGVTLFGKVKLKAKACVACDRPFTPSAAGQPGPPPTGGINGAAVEPTYLPDESSHVTKDAFRPHTSSARLGSPLTPSSPLDGVEPHTSIFSAFAGGRASLRSPHVFRGGFKLPKHLKSPLHASEGEGQAAFGMGHTSPLLHESRLITGLQAGAHDGRHDSSNGIPLKIRRPPGDLFRHQTPQPSISITDDASSVVSAFTVRTDGSRTVVADGHSQDGYGFASADVEQGHFLHEDDDTISTASQLSEASGSSRRMTYARMPFTVRADESLSTN